jgi:hypothetical protein
MKQVGVVPDWCLIKAFSKEFGVDVIVHEDGIGAIRFSLSNNGPEIHQQSLRCVHFNLLLPDGEDVDEMIINHIDIIRARKVEGSSSQSVMSSAFLYNLVNDDDADVKQKRLVVCRRRTRRSPEAEEALGTSTGEVLPESKPKDLLLHLTDEDLKRLQAEDPTLVLMKELTEMQFTQQDILNRLKLRRNGHQFSKLVHTLT